jgi:hypothetical protein
MDGQLGHASVGGMLCPSQAIFAPSASSFSAVQLVAGVPMASVCPFLLVAEQKSYSFQSIKTDQNRQEIVVKISSQKTFWRRWWL